MYHDLPVIILAGDGGSGKDTVAAEMCRQLSLPYKTSTSFVAAKKMWPQVEAGRFNNSSCCPYQQMEHYDIRPCDFHGLQHWYNERSMHRRFWADWVDCYNKASATKCQLYTDCVEEGNFILTGIRKAHELEAFIATNIPDLVIWIDRPGNPRDPTQEYGPEKCDLVFLNDSDMLAIKMRVHNLAMFTKAARLM